MFDPGARFIHGHEYDDRTDARSNFAFRDGGSAHVDQSRGGGWIGDQEEVHFRASTDGDDDSGYCSPRLWHNSPSPPRSPSQPLLSHRGAYCRPLSPNSRVQRIVSGQRELMEMVRSMPDSSYELSLQDLVEHPHRRENQSINQLNQSPPRLDGLGNNPNLQQRGASRVKGREFNKIDKNVMRNGSFESRGLFLKMPISVQRKSNGGKVSPKPVTTEKDWWKKKFTGSSDSDSSRTSNNSGSSGSTATGSATSGSSSTSHGRSRTKKTFARGCWPFSRIRRRKSA